MACQYLFLDFESLSLLNLKEVGLDRYVKHESTKATMLGWAPDHEDVDLWLPHLGPMPERLLTLLHDASVLKVAWHSPFEQNILKYPLKIDIPTEQFRDPIILAHNLSLPGKLEDVARILKMQEQKDERGKELIKMFSYPVSMGGEQTLFGISPPLFRNHNSHPREFKEFCDYCIQDVKVERELWFRLSKIPMPEREWQGWLLDQKINAFGMPGRRDLAEKGLRLAQKFISKQRALLKEKTGLENPNSDPQMKAWATERGYPWNSLRAPTVRAELNNPDSKITPECREALTLRSSARKSSYTKIEKFLSLLSDDDRLRHQFRYMGAARTGRWASGGGDKENASMQVQNMFRGEKAVKKKLALALELLEREDYDGMEYEFPSLAVVEVIATLLRSLFQAKAGKKFIVADLNAIENRVLGWMAGCNAITDVFKRPKEDGGDPYLAFGTHLYNKTYAEMWATYSAGNEEERQNCKAPVLSGGFGQGGGDLYINEYGDEVRGGVWGYALYQCGVDMPKELAHKAVEVLRAAWPEVVQLWTDLEEAFKQVLMRGGIVKVGEVTWDQMTREWVEHPTKGQQCVLTFTRISMEGGGYIIRMELPSGRGLHYINATIETEAKISKKGNPYTARTIYYDGIEHSATKGADGKNNKKRMKWGRVRTNGPKLCENGDQAISRDTLLNGLFLADNMGFDLWGIFHDEAAAEVDNDCFGLQLDDLIWCLTQTPEWAKGLILGADGWEGQVYRK